MTQQSVFPETQKIRVSPDVSGFKKLLIRRLSIRLLAIRVGGWSHVLPQIKETEFCAVKGDRIILIVACAEQNVLQFQNWACFTDDFTREDADRFAAAINEEMIMIRAYVSDPGDKKISVVLNYSHAILDHESISAKSIVKLTRMVENHVMATFEIYDRLFLKRR